MPQCNHVQVYRSGRDIFQSLLTVGIDVLLFSIFVDPERRPKCLVNLAIAWHSLSCVRFWAKD